MAHKRIGLFGGAFDPPHVEHANAIRAVLRSGIADEVWIVPAGKRVEKQMVASGEDRLLMCALMVQEEFGDDSRVMVRREQAEGEKLSFSVDILDGFKQRYPSCEFCLVVGSDVVGDIPNWKEGNELLRKVPFIIVERDGPIEKDLILPQSCVMLKRSKRNAQMNYSSTAVRALCQDGGDISTCVTPAVREFIKENGLYKE